MSSPADRRAHVVRSPELVMAEVALTLVTAAAVVGFTRVLEGDVLGPMLATALAAHLVAAGCRRRAWSVPRATLAVMGAGAVLLTWLLFPASTFLGVPTPATLDAASDALRSAWTTFQDVSAPAPVEPGFLLAAGIAVVFAAFLADWAAFRLWSPFEAIVPTTTLFIFCSLLGGSRDQVLAAAVFAGAVVAFLLAHRVARRALGGSWIADDERRGSRSLLVSGAALGAMALVVGVATGPRLPGAEEDAVLEWRGQQDQGSQRVTISPLVDIRARLVDQSDVELFEVEATERAYWRLTSLDTFEDGIWKSSGRYTTVNGDLPGGVDDEATIPADQVFTIEALSALWLPAAFEPTEVEAASDVRYHEGSATLIVDTDVADSDGFVYRVRSALPRHTPDELRAAGDAIPSDVADQYLALPADTSALAQQLALEWTAGATSSYDKALALQDEFQRSFTYSLEVPPGHSPNAIDAFLQLRTGYCEQFAGTFAVMARQLGIPARVAVGFTPGEQDPADERRYRVRGEHAHAWPEVWLGDAGWVSFEPTPGRGAPGAEAYTGLPEAQDTSGPATSPTTQATTPTSTAPGTSIDPAAPAPSTTTPDVAPAAPSLGGGSSDDGSGPAGTVATVLAVAFAAYLLAVPLGLAARRRLRRRRAVTPAARIRLAWTEATDAMADAGTPQLPHETASELAARAGRRLPGVEGPLGRLAHAVDLAVFAPPGELDAGAADAADADASAVAHVADARTHTGRRLLRHLDIRRFGRPHAGSSRHVVGSGAPTARLLTDG